MREMQGRRGEDSIFDLKVNLERRVAVAQRVVLTIFLMLLEVCQLSRYGCSAGKKVEWRQTRGR